MDTYFFRSLKEMFMNTMFERNLPFSVAHTEIIA
jgi:hypothetical protein